MPMTPEQFYAAANLTANPFRTNPTVEGDPRKGIWVGYRREKETLLKFLTRSRSDQVGNINFVMIFGEFGIGKSHALLWSQYHISQEAKAEFESEVFYIPTLKKSKGQMSFAQAFRDDIVLKSGLITNLVYYKRFLDTCIVQYMQDKKLGVEASRESVLSFLLPSIDLINQAKAILDIKDENTAGALVNSKTDYDALLLFARLVNLFVFEYKLPSGSRRFKKAVYLLIDELDVLAEAPAKEAREINDLIRHLYDLCPNAFCLVVAFTATVAELSMMFAPYVLDRVSRQIILDFLQPAEAKQFVREILDTARVDNSRNTGFFPFSEEAVDSIVSQIVSITPRKVVSNMQQIIEEVRLAGVDPSQEIITTQVLDDKEIWQEVT